MNELFRIAEDMIDRAEANMPKVRRFDPDARTLYPYRLTENGTTLPLIVDCNSLDEAVERAKVYCFHKEHLLIRDIGGGKDRCHLYAIKKRSAPTYVYRDHDYHRQDRLYAAHVCSFDAAVLVSLSPSLRALKNTREAGSAQQAPVSNS